MIVLLATVWFWYSVWFTVLVLCWIAILALAVAELMESMSKRRARERQALLAWGAEQKAREQRALKAWADEAAARRARELAAWTAAEKEKT